MSSYVFGNIISFSINIFYIIAIIILLRVAIKLDNALSIYINEKTKNK